MICDFCSSPNVTWEHNCKPFVVAHYDDDGQWAACDLCHELIQAGDREGLLDRTVACDPKPKVDGLRRTVRHLHDGFWAGYIGCVPISEKERTAEHRVVAVTPVLSFGDLFVAKCICGWESAPGRHNHIRSIFEQHSGGIQWTVADAIQD